MRTAKRAALAGGAGAAMLAAALWGGASTCRAEEDPAPAAAKLYDLVFKAEPASLAPGGAGKIVVRIVAKNGGEVHAETPISLKFEAPEQVTLAKAKLGKPDVKIDGVSASFEAPFTAAKAGSASVKADLAFYICTAKACTKQQRKGTVEIAVK